MTRDSRSIRPSSIPRPALPTVAARGIRARAPDKEVGKPSAEPIYQTSVFDFPSIEASLTSLAGGEGYVYARYGLPNGRSLERTVAALEGAEDGVATSSGTSAVLCGLLATTRRTGRILCQRDAYGGTRALLEQDLTRFGFVIEYVDAYDPAQVADALSRGADVVLVESVSNPLVREVNVTALSWHCRSYGARLMVDNTFATPVFRRPIMDGADLVVHSATKFLGGHHDLCLGVLVGPSEVIIEARMTSLRMGTQAPAFDAWLAARGIKTLDVRMQRSDENARSLCDRLRDHPAVKTVHYPGWGAMLSFDVGSREAAERVVSRSTAIPLTPSLGGTETSFSHSATSSHRALSEEERLELGIGQGLLRLSVGIEDVEDLWMELERALAP